MKSLRFCKKSCSFNLIFYLGPINLWLWPKAASYKSVTAARTSIMKVRKSSPANPLVVQQWPQAPVANPEISILGILVYVLKKKKSKAIIWRPRVGDQHEYN